MSSDYYLTKIYESLNKSPSKCPKESISPKKFQSLQQSYYQVIFKKINEDTDILMQQKGSDNVEEFTVSDDLADKIKKHIDVEISREVNGKKTSLREIIDIVLKSKKWHEGTDSYLELLKTVLDIFSDKKINFEKILDYPQLVVDKNKSFVEQEFLNKPKQILSLLNLIPSWFNDFFEDKKGIEIASKLWNIRFKQKNMVGRGELMFTLISDCKKGDENSVGDLFFDTLGSVEVKGLAGKMGGDGFVNVSTSKLLNDIYTKKTKETEKTIRLSSQIVNLVKNNIFKILDDAIKDTKRKKPLNLKQIEEIKFKIDSLESYNEIEELINQVGFKQVEKNNIIKEINNFLKKKRTYGRTNSSKDADKLNIFKNDYAHSLEAFFTSYLNLSDEQLIEGILACRSYVKPLPEEFKNYLEKEIASKKNYYFSESFLTKNLINVIASLHAVEYQEAKKFNGFIFMNDNNKKIVYYPFEKETSYTEKFKSFYTFLDNFKPTISISMSDQQKSVNIAFTKI